ncbi:MAG: helix-turn-helix domain-containing protein [Candidatus Gastranaerophilaceae bacterium]
MSSFEDYFYKNIAKQVRKYRLERGYTQEKLSEILSKNLKYIGHIERCERKISNTMLIKLLEILKVQPVEFYSFNEQYKWS